MNNDGLVVRSIPFEVDALDAYIALSQGPGSILLEGCGSRRWDVVLSGPIMTLPRKTLDTRVLRLLEKARRVPSNGTGLPFTGGVAGFASYEACVKHSSRVDPRHEPIYPGVWIGLYDRALLIDRASKSTYAIVNLDLGDGIESDAKSMLTRVTKTRGRAFGEIPRAKIVLEFPRKSFERGVANAKRHIREGDVYQVNIAHRLRLDGGIDPLALYSQLRFTNPSPHMGYADLGDVKIVCNSPERLLLVDGSVCETRPIAGTRPRGRDARADRAMLKEITTDEKELAEHTMMVDLERNDLGRISAPGSVSVDELMSVERYSHVMHLVSNVRGKLCKGTSASEMMSAMMPGGTVSGVPKSKALEIIDALEPVARGPYTGSLGYVSSGVEMNIMIRTITFTQSGAYLYVGSGIVHDSVPKREYEETIHKANATLSILTGGASMYSVQAITTRGSWSPPIPRKRFHRSRVLLVDNYDSFTYNLAQYVSSTGAKVDVVPRDAIPRQIDAFTHVMISPGPGRPEDAKGCIELILREEEVPILGVCMGHQAIALAFGGEIENTEPVHGKVSKVRILHGSPMLSSLPRKFDVARYHSLIVDPSSLPEELRVDAITSDGTIMALSHRERKLYGVQFHPESVLTPHGLMILENFLEVSP